MQRAKPSRRRAALALAAVGAVVAVALVELPSGASGGASFVLLGGLTPAAAPARIVAGPDGNLWFTEPGISKVGRISPSGVVNEFVTATANAGPTGITTGPDGNLWFTEPAVNRVGSMTPTGAASDIALGSGTAPARVVTGPDHNLWVTEPGAHAIARVTTGGVVTSFPLNDPSATPTDITSGPDGNLWFTETHGHFIGRISTVGAVAEFSAPGVTSAGGIAAGPDGALWFGEGSGKIGRLTTSGALAEWVTPTPSPGIADVTPGNDGNVWFAEQSAGQIGAITPGGVVTEWAVPNHDAPNSVVLGPDANMWFAASGNNIIGHVTAVANGGTTTTSSSSTSSSTSSTTSSTSTSTTSTTVAGHVALTRLSGSDRVATAIAISAQTFTAKGSANAVVLASGWSFADALAGAPLAAAKGGPLLLTPTASLDARVKTEIARVLPAGGTVYVLGGPQAVDPSVDAALVTAGFQVSRLAGTDRFNTATMIAGALGDPSTIYEATGLDFPDALSAAALAAINRGAILLTNGAQQAPQTAAYLSAHANDARTALGGAAAAADPSATPVAGKDRFETSAKAAALVQSPAVVGVANGYAFPDALAGGAAIGSGGGPLLLVPPTGSVPGSVQAWCTAAKPGVTKVEVFGGQAAVPDAVANAVKTALGG
jgi:streptogramin lyase/putative cell wall-binding protein